MIFSALVDADYVDTARHFGASGLAADSLAVMAKSFEAAREAYLRSVPVSPVDAVRAEVYEQAVQAAARSRGVFPFAAPTGAGKTIAAGGFAVHHAARHGLRRVVIAVPFLSITEQNARVYRRLFGEEHVLEHHSGVDLDGLPERLRWQRLAAENWDAPVVVTTTVQLFESLFSRKPSAMRKVHRLTGSVVVLDEVQALPDALLLPVLSALRHLTEHFGSSVLLASATQPQFFSLEPFRDLRAHEVIARPGPLYDRLRRVSYRWMTDPRPSLGEVAAEAAGERQVLLIVNTTGDAARLHMLVQAAWSQDGPVLHLSTRMASGHRQAALDQVRERLAGDLPVAVVSTQLVEAGVDLDFPAVYRAFGPAEALQQAAGRANRNGRRPVGRVIVFDPSDGSVTAPQRIYGAALGATKAHFGPDKADPDDLDALAAYYRRRYALKNVESAGPGQRIQALRAEFDFPEVAALFRLIDERTVPVAVRYGDTARLGALISQLTCGDSPRRQAYRQIQPYLAVLPRDLAVRAVRDGLATVLAGDLHEWHGQYDELRGIHYAPPSDEDYIW
jgi:CRISPR-associated endonuclease/helicase Cas3